MRDSIKAYLTLATCTFAFFISVAIWSMNSVMVVYFINKGIFSFSSFQIGLLIAVPILTGALCRIPLGILTDRFGGKRMFPLVMLISSLFLVAYGFSSNYTQFLLCSLGFGLAGGVFAIGIPYIMLWFPKERQGFAAGVFVLAGSGVALTSALAPQMLYYFTHNGVMIENWRYLPFTYAALMVVTSALFYFFAFPKIAEGKEKESIIEKIKLGLQMRVLRFGLYYAFSFGGFIAISQWLILYYVSVYDFSVRDAGLYATIFSIPCAFIRVFGGWLSDKIGPRRVMYMVFGLSVLVSLFLIFPQMELTSFGRGVYASADGKVVSVTKNAILLESQGKMVQLLLVEKPKVDTIFNPEHRHVFPEITHWNEPKVQEGEVVVKNAQIAYGVTHLYFNPPVWFFTTLVFLLGLLLGIGVVGVFKYVPFYFEKDVGTVSGVVGAIGGIGGFLFPILFSVMLDITGFWTSCWFLLGVLALICLLWLHRTVQKLLKDEELLIKSLL